MPPWAPCCVRSLWQRVGCRARRSDQAGYQLRDGIAELLYAERLTKEISGRLEQDFIQSRLAGIGADEEDREVGAAFAYLTETVRPVHAKKAIIKDDETIIGISAVEQAQSFFCGIACDRAKAKGAQKTLENRTNAWFIIDYEGCSFLRVSGHVSVSCVRFWTRLSSGPVILSTQMVQVRATQIIGTHPSMLVLNDQINYLASSAVQPAFIFGEPGTGKRLVSRAIHEATHGNSADCRFLNGVWYRTPGSLPELRQTPGVRECSDVLGKMERGTLIVHEVSQVAREVQGALVEWIEAGQGGGSGPRRLVATSSISIERLRASSSLDPKLLAILSTSRLELLPLTERGDDVLLLARYFLERDAGLLQAGALSLDSAIQQRLLAAPFMSNVAELEWFVQKSLMLGRWLTESLFPATHDEARRLTDSTSHIHLIFRVGEMTMDDVEGHFVREVLRLCKGKQSQAAHILGLSRGALYRRMEKLSGDEDGEIFKIRKNRRPRTAQANPPE